MCCTVLCIPVSHPVPSLPFIFFFNDTATTEIYTLSLHDALPIYDARQLIRVPHRLRPRHCGVVSRLRIVDRKSTRLNSSHQIISYAVFCLKKKKTMLIVIGITNTQNAAANQVQMRELPRLPSIEF